LTSIEAAVGLYIAFLLWFPNNQIRQDGRKLGQTECFYVTDKNALATIGKFSLWAAEALLSKVMFITNSDSGK
jgi:hypothetical protein